MDREILIKDTLTKIQQLPDLRIQEINDFADFLLSKIEDSILLEGIQKLTSDSKSFEYLKNEEDLYSVNDINNFNKSCLKNRYTSKTETHFASTNLLGKDWLQNDEDKVWKDL